jgi:hypothetical protein
VNDKVTTTLAELAAKIKTQFDRADEIERKAFEEAEDHRLEAGRLLIKARKLVERGGWERWCKDNVGKSRQEIARLMKMAGSPDPAAAREKEKETNRVKKQNQRRRAAEASSPNAISSKPKEDVTDTGDVSSIPAVNGAGGDGHLLKRKPVETDHDVAILIASVKALSDAKLAEFDETYLAYRVSRGLGTALDRAA